MKLKNDQIIYNTVWVFVCSSVLQKVIYCNLTSTRVYMCKM